MISGDDILVRLIGDGSSYHRMIRNAAMQTGILNRTFQTGVAAQAAFRVSTSGTGASLRFLSSGYQGVGDSASSLMSTLASLGLVIGAVSIGRFITGSIAAAGSLERLQIEMENFTGGAKETTATIDRMMQFAAETPLNIPEVLQGARTLYQYQAAGEDVTQTMRMLGDVVSGDPDRFRRMVLAYGQVRQAGRLMGQEVLQMVNAGFNPLFVISQATGRSMDYLRRAMRDGRISFDLVRQSMLLATQAGGMFHDRMRRVAQTVPGLWSNLKDQIYIAQIAIGGFIIKTFGLHEVLRGLTGGVKAFVDWMKQLSGDTQKWIGSVLGAIIVVGSLTLAFRALGVALNFVFASSKLMLLFFAGIVAGTALAINALGGWQATFEMMQYGIENFQQTWEYAATSAAYALVVARDFIADAFIGLVATLSGVGGAIVALFTATWQNVQAGWERVVNWLAGGMAWGQAYIEALASGASMEEAIAAAEAAEANIGAAQNQFVNMGEAMGEGFQNGFNNAVENLGGMGPSPEQELLGQDLDRMARGMVGGFEAWRSQRREVKLGGKLLRDEQVDLNSLLGDELKKRKKITEEVDKLKFLLRDSAEATFRIYDYTQSLRGPWAGSAGGGSGGVAASGSGLSPGQPSQQGGGGICNCPIWTEIRNLLAQIAGQPQIVVGTPQAGGKARP